MASVLGQERERRERKSSRCWVGETNVGDRPIAAERLSERGPAVEETSAERSAAAALHGTSPFTVEVGCCPNCYRTKHSLHAQCPRHRNAMIGVPPKQDTQYHPRTSFNPFERLGTSLASIAHCRPPPSDISQRVVFINASVGIAHCTRSFER